MSNRKTLRAAVARAAKIKHSNGHHVRRSVLRYFGGKWAIAPWVIDNLPPRRIYVEPFAGAASVLLRKPRSRVEVYNDADAEIVGIFRLLQDPASCAKLVRLLRRTPYSRVEFLRAFEPSDDPMIRAQRAIIRAYQGYHHEALFNPRKTTFADARHRKNGGHSKAGEWRNCPRTLAHVCRRMQGVIIEQRDALDVISVQDGPHTLFFVDPPYLPITRSKAGYRHELSNAQHIELLDKLRAIRGMAVIAGYPSALYDDALYDWRRIDHLAYAACSATGRTEVLWINPSAQQAQI